MSRKNAWEIAIGFLALISIVLVVVESLCTLSKSTLIGIYLADLLICIAFAFDFSIRMKSSGSKLQFLKTSGYEILAMVPALALYALGSIPAIAVALRSLRLVRVIRVVVLISRMGRFLSTSGSFLKRSHLLALLIATVSIIFIGAYAAMLLESGHENAQITNFSDAVWWSISTVTTVGYGDIVPRSVAGRFMGMGLMVVGIGVMTAFISQVSAALVESRLRQSTKNNDLRSTLISEIKDRLDNIDKLTESDFSLLIQMIQTLKADKGNNNLNPRDK